MLNQQVFRLTEPTKKQLRNRYYLLDAVLVAAWLWLAVTQYNSRWTQDSWWLSVVFVGIFIAVRIYFFERNYRHQRDYSLRINQEGLIMDLGFRAMTIQYADLAVIYKTNKHLLVLGRFPEQSIIIPSTLEDFDQIEFQLRALRPVIETGKPLERHYARQLFPERNSRATSSIFVIIAVAFIYPFLFILAPSNKKQKERKTEQVNTPPFSPVDSFFLHPSTGSLQWSKAGSYYAGKVNGVSFGIAGRGAEAVWFCVEEKGVWKMNDRITLPLVWMNEVTLLDLNNDGFTDIRISGYEPGSEEEGAVVLLFDPRSKCFEHSSSYDHPELRYDSLLHQPTSIYWDPEISGDVKQTFTIDGDSLVPDKGVRIIDTTDNDRHVLLEFYEYRNGVSRVTKTYTGDYESMYALFSKSLWNSETEAEQKK